MDKAKISIIVPVYNSARYLRQCLQSIAGQTFRGLEVIIVDNASADNSLAIVKEFTSPVFKILQITGGTPGSARNAGIEQASGDYLFFLDSDDWLHQDTLQILYTKATEHNADITAAELYHTDEAGQKLSACIQNIPPLVLEKPKHSHIDFFKAGIAQEKPTNKLIKKDLILSSNIRFHEQPLEDTVFTGALYALAAKAVHTGQPLYYYRHKDTSLSKAAAKASPLDIFKSFIPARENLRAKGVYPNIEEEYEYTLLQKICGGEQPGSGTLENLDKKDFNAFCDAAAPFYASMKPGLFKKRNIMFKIKMFFLKLILKYRLTVMPKLTKIPLTALGFLYYPLKGLIDLF